MTEFPRYLDRASITQWVELTESQVLRGRARSFDDSLYELGRLRQPRHWRWRLSVERNRGHVRERKLPLSTTGSSGLFERLDVSLQALAVAPPS